MTEDPVGVDFDGAKPAIRAERHVRRGARSDTSSGSLYMVKRCGSVFEIM